MFRKIVKMIRGAASPAGVFRACLLGVMLGMVPGFNLTALLLMLALLLLNHSLLLGGIALGLGKALCHLLAPVTFHIGYFLIHGLGLEGLFRALSQTPVLALMDLHVYCLVGGLPVALIVGGGAGWLLARTLVEIRRLLAKAGEGSPRLAELTRRRPVRILLRILFGKQKASMAELVHQKAPLFRKSGLLLTGAAVAVVIVAEVLLSGPMLRRQAERGLSAAVGAEVNIAHASLSLLRGKMEIEGLQVTDPADPNRNAVQAGRIAAQLSVPGLLAKRLVISELAVTDVQTGSPRQTPGWVASKEEEAPPPPPATLPGLEEAEPLMEYFQDPRKLQRYQQYLRKARERLARSRQRSEGKPDPQQDKADLAREAENQGYLSLSAAHLLAKRPVVTVRKMTVSGVRLQPAGPTYELDGREVSPSPELNESPMTLKLTGSDGLLAAVELDHHSPAQAHRIEVKVSDVDLKDMGLSDKSPVRVDGGRADVHVQGTFRHDGMVLPATVRIRDFQGAAREGRTVLGLSAQDSQQAFSHLKEFELHLVLSGTLDRPQLTVDGSRTLASLRDALVKAGQRELADRAGQELQKLTGKLPLPTGLPGLPGLGSPASLPSGGQPGLPGILPGLGRPADQPQGPDANRPPQRPGLLDGLLR